MNANSVAAYLNSFPTTQPLITDLERQMEGWVLVATAETRNVEVKINARNLAAHTDAAAMIKHARTRLENWFKVNQWTEIASQVDGEGESMTITVSASLPPVQK